MSMDLVTAPELEAESVDQADDRPAVGSWWWVTAKSERQDESRYDRSGRQWLGCVVEVGSNYAKVEGVRLRQRIGMDDFHAMCKPEPQPHGFIDSQISKHRDQVRRLMGKIRDLCHKLGVPMRHALAAQESSSTALAVAHSVDDVKKYKSALVKAKEKALPELYDVRRPPWSVVQPQVKDIP